jgi:hypothetical protein
MSWSGLLASGSATIRYSIECEPQKFLKQVCNCGGGLFVVVGRIDFAANSEGLQKS